MSWLRTLTVAVPAMLIATGALAAPQVVTTLPPLHSIAASVMGDHGTPTLLLQGTSSPHGFALRPSHMKAISQADLIFMMDEKLEAFMHSALEATNKEEVAIELFDQAPIAQLDFREGGVWAAHDHGEHEDHDAHDEHGDHHDHDDHHEHEAEDHDAHEGHDHGSKDPHAWLSPTNGAAFAQVMAHYLGKIDPEHADDYASNANTYANRLYQLDAELKQQLAPIQSVPHVVFHDAYHYFQERYNLNTVGSITVSPERKPGAKQLSELRHKIAELGAQCLFSEPQFKPAVVKSIAQDTGVKTGELDPLGARLTPGPELYETLVRNLAKSMSDCMGG